MRSKHKIFAVLLCSRLHPADCFHQNVLSKAIEAYFKIIFEAISGRYSILCSLLRRRFWQNGQSLDLFWKFRKKTYTYVI